MGEGKKRGDGRPRGREKGQERAGRRRGGKEGEGKGKGRGIPSNENPVYGHVSYQVYGSSFTFLLRSCYVRA